MSSSPKYGYYPYEGDTDTVVYGDADTASRYAPYADTPQYWPKMSAPADREPPSSAEGEGPANVGEVGPNPPGSGRRGAESFADAFGVGAPAAPSPSSSENRGVTVEQRRRQSMLRHRGGSRSSLPGTSLLRRT